ncbi:MAG: hypothetical protein Q9197_006793 [Variospora fuerteventurae]
MRSAPPFTPRSDLLNPDLRREQPTLCVLHRLWSSPGEQEMTGSKTLCVPQPPTLAFVKRTLPNPTPSRSGLCNLSLSGIGLQRLDLSFGGVELDLCGAAKKEKEKLEKSMEKDMVGNLQRQRLLQESKAIPLKYLRQFG